MAKIRSLWLEQQQQQTSSSRLVHDHHDVHHHQIIQAQPQPEPQPEPEPLAVVPVEKKRSIIIRGDDGLKYLRLFGVNIPIHHLLHINIDHHHHASSQTQAMMKRKSTEDDDLPESSNRLPKRPKLLSLQIDQQQQQQQQQQQHQQVAPRPRPRPRPVMLFTKRLTDSDVLPQHNRLLITKSDSEILLAALTDEERTKVATKGDYLHLLATTPNNADDAAHEDEDEEFELHLTRWVGSGALVLKYQWIKLVRANNLQQGDSVQAFGYRLRSQFRLAFNVIRKEEDH